MSYAPGREPRTLATAQPIRVVLVAYLAAAASAAALAVPVVRAVLPTCTYPKSTVAALTSLELEKLPLE